ncbi:MAG TPA: ABC transporter ATP-binding protein [Rariglobus sp.]|jgi:ABC-type multidrug transport system ATPase subunit|nr:ABC transporter ATP-binding protein [Rariglobus sp.]
MILVHNLKKSFGRLCVLTGLNLTVEPGAVTLLVGSNGAGKTTALRLMAGLSVADAGTITLAGYNLERDRAAALARCSFLPQAPRFHPRLTVRQVTEFYARLRGHQCETAAFALKTWGMDPFENVPTGKLSGGLRQRLALAIFSLADAPVLLLDEPGLSLDPEWRECLQQFLRKEALRGCTVLVATHLLGEWEGRADRCLLVEDGRSQGELPPDKLREYFPRLGRKMSEGIPLELCA